MRQHLDDNYACLLTSVSNRTDSPLTIKPEIFSLEQNSEVINPISLEDVLKNIRNRVRWYSSATKRAENKLRLKGANEAALKLHTIYKSEYVGGAVFFDLKNLVDAFNVSFNLLGDNYKVDFKLPK